MLLGQTLANTLLGDLFIYLETELKSIINERRREQNKSAPEQG